MALVWEKFKGSNHYQVRSAGASIRLYTNGVLHSQYNPNRLFTGAIWDLLSVPVLYASHRYDAALHRPNGHAPSGVSRVLILGLGGGTVVHQLQRLLRRPQITAVEIDPVHIQIARKYYRLKLDDVDIVNDDAASWSAAYNGHKFDLVVDDLFLSDDHAPVRHPFDCMNYLDNLLAADGIYLRNAFDRIPHAIPGRFKSVKSFTHPRYDNVVLAFYPHKVDSRRARVRVRRTLEHLQKGAYQQLRYTCRTLL